MPDLRAAEYPGTFSTESDTLMRKRLEEKTFDQIVEALTGQPKPAARAKTPGNTKKVLLDGTFEEINESFREQKLTDELPIIPPTLERVAEFLQYTDRAADEEIGILRPGNLRATTSIIAANAVMAGCRPEHMPILIAAVEAISDPTFNLEQIGTTGGVNPYLLINGPIIKQLGIKFDIGLISRGPNPSLGRALGLITRNVANLRPAEQNMGTFGYILPFVLAEDEEKSPWEPYHVEHGFKQVASTVTAGASQNWGFQAFPSGTDPEGQLQAICQDIVKRIVLWGPLLHHDSHIMTVLITPPVARVLADGGYSKQDVKKYIFENSRVSISHLDLILKHGFAGGDSETIRGLIEKKIGIPEEWGDLGPNDTVPALIYPNVINIAVCGDRSRNKTMALHAAYIQPVTKEIKLPANWDNLPKKNPS